jgi:hypothetical protein
VLLSRFYFLSVCLLVLPLPTAQVWGGQPDKASADPQTVSPGPEILPPSAVLPPPVPPPVPPPPVGRGGLIQRDDLPQEPASAFWQMPQQIPIAGALEKPPPFPLEGFPVQGRPRKEKSCPSTRHVSIWQRPSPFRNSAWCRASTCSRTAW